LEIKQMQLEKQTNAEHVYVNLQMKKAFLYTARIG